MPNVKKSAETIMSMCLDVMNGGIPEETFSSNLILFSTLMSGKRFVEATVPALADALKELGVTPLIWQPIEEAPYDETIVVFCEKDASIYRDVIYDQDIQDYKKKTGVTHFMKFTIPGE